MPQLRTIHTTGTEVTEVTRLPLPYVVHHSRW